MDLDEHYGFGPLRQRFYGRGGITRAARRARAAWRAANAFIREHANRDPSTGQARARWDINFGVPKGESSYVNPYGSDTQPYPPGSRTRPRTGAAEEEPPAARRRIEFGPRNRVGGMPSVYAGRFRRGGRSSADVYDLKGAKHIHEISDSMFVEASVNPILRLVVQSHYARQTLRQIGLALLRYCSVGSGHEVRDVSDFIQREHPANTGAIVLYFNQHTVAGAVTSSRSIFVYTDNFTRVSGFMDWFADTFAAVYDSANDIRLVEAVRYYSYNDNGANPPLITTLASEMWRRPLENFKVSVRTITDVVIQNNTESDTAFNEHADNVKANPIVGKLHFSRGPRPMYKQGIWTNNVNTTVGTGGGSIPPLHTNWDNNEVVQKPLGNWTGYELDLLDSASLRSVYSSSTVRLQPGQSKSFKISATYSGFADRMIRALVWSSQLPSATNGLQHWQPLSYYFKNCLVEFKQLLPADDTPASAHYVQMQYRVRQTTCVVGWCRHRVVMRRQFLSGLEQAQPGFAADGGGAEVVDEPVTDAPAAPQLLAVADPSDGDAARAARAAQHAETDTGLEQLPSARPIKRVRRVRSLAEHATEGPSA